MKQSYLIGLATCACILTSLSAGARERSVSEMQSLACQTLQTNGAHRLASIDASTLKVLQQNTQLSILGRTNGGFAVVSHDDKIPAILGYSYECFDPNNRNLVSYLEELNGYIDYCLETGSEFRVIRRVGGANESLAPLMKTKWDQTSPYNLDCPTYNGRHCVTGCVATAAAQIFKHLELPKTMHGRKIYTFENDGNERERIVYDYDGVTFDWDNMLNTYSMIAKDVEEQAVAKLMYCCGVSSNMDYSTGESGSWPYITADAINYYMDGLHAENTFLGGKEQTVFNELDAGHPILYNGATTQGAHAFVIDGYDADSKVHCNMGWSGGGDGYYTLADMNGYRNNQQITLVYPSEEQPYTAAPCADVPEGNITVNFVPATELVPDTQWYLLYNVGRSGHAVSAGKGKTLVMTSYLPIDDPAEVGAPHIVRFVTSTNSKKPGYFIQTGDGFYYGSLVDGESDESTNKGTTSSKTVNYSYGTIKPGYFWFRDEKNSTVMDSNNPGKDLCGWGNTLPKDTAANSSWQIYPIEFSIPEGVKNTPVEETLEVSEYDLQGRLVARPERGQFVIRSRKKIIR